MANSAYLVKAFTQNKNEGNPAGVVLDADNLSDGQMIKISADLGFSESAFVQNSSNAEFRIRFFTATQEVDLCGHATIAAFHTLLETHNIPLAEAKSITLTQETKAGILPVMIYADGLIVMSQTQPVFGESATTSTEIAQLLGITEADFVSGMPIQSVSTGSPKLMIPVRSRKLLFAIQPDLEGIVRYCQSHNMKGFYPFTTDTIAKDADFHARQFNPLAGIDEDPITGIAAGALGAYACKYKLLQKPRCIIEQGTIMHKPGRMYVEINDEVTVGGYAVTFGTKEV